MVEEEFGNIQQEKLISVQNTVFQFTSLLKSTEGLHLAHLDSFVTVFAPSNDAMEAFGGVKDDNLILNHMGKLLQHLLDQFKYFSNKYFQP